VVDPAKISGAVRDSGFQVVLRPGPTPAPFVRAIYGVARNARGRSVNFGFFVTANTSAGEDLTPAVEKLVPGATAEGSTAGESYVAVTSAGAPHGPERQTKEEFEIADRLQLRVAHLAGEAFVKEGP
jgi:hypothetical protein